MAKHWGVRELAAYEAKTREALEAQQRMLKVTQARLTAAA